MESVILAAWNLRSHNRKWDLLERSCTHACREGHRALLLTGDEPPVCGWKQTIGHAVMETFLVLNGFEIRAGVDDAERVILSLAAGELLREELLDWVTAWLVPVDEPPI